MSKQKHYLALDFGTSKGLAMSGSFDGTRLAFDLLNRFPVESTTMLGTKYWDFPGMIINVKRGLAEFAARNSEPLSGVACDSWGCDFGLLDKTGHLLANPVHHLDARTLETMDRLHATMPVRSVYQKTGMIARREGTLYQLHAMAIANSPLLDKAVTMLLMADLMSYFLTGVPVQEYTLATTSGMYDAESRDWCRDIILSARIPPVMLPEIIAPGSVIGPLVDDVAAECGVGQIPVLASGSHAMAGAVAAAPARGDDWLYVVSGDWNQVGVELTQPLINDSTFAGDFCNEGGVDGTIRLLKGLMGHGLIERCRAKWNETDGEHISKASLLELAAKEHPMRRIVNPDDPAFANGDSVVDVMNAFLSRTGQPVANSRGEVVRCLVDSLVLSHRQAFELVAAVTDRRYQIAHVVGWGAGDKLLCQLVADATGMAVKAGPVEAKAVGNIIMQAIALGDIACLAEAREIIAASFDIAVYEPKGDKDAWDEAYATFLKLVRA